MIIIWYHTGDETWDDFVDENIDIFIDIITVYGIYKVKDLFKEKVGMTVSWTVIALMAAKWGANAAGYYLAGLIDPDQGRSKWNEFIQRSYDWGAMDVDILGFQLGDAIPNPFAVAEIVAESVVDLHDYVAPLVDHSIDIGLSHFTSWLTAPLRGGGRHFTFPSPRALTEYPEDWEPQPSFWTR